MAAPHDAHAPTHPDDRAAVLRRDRAVTDDVWIERMLAVAPVGSLATVADGSPFLNVNLFWFDPVRRAVYVHTARRGRTRSNVEAAESEACFVVHEMGRLLPGATALEFSVEYTGVVPFGPIAVVDDPVEAAVALQALLDEYAPHLEAGRDYQGLTAEELARTTVMRLDVATWSGKRKVVDFRVPRGVRVCRGIGARRRSGVAAPVPGASVRCPPGPRMRSGHEGRPRARQRWAAARR